MKYILIANNDYIEKEIESLEIEKDDVIVLFNYIKPIKYKKIRDHSNLIAFSRKKSKIKNPLKDVYAGMESIRIYEKKFKKVIFHRPPDHYPEDIKKACLNAIEKFGFLGSEKCLFIDDRELVKKCSDNKKSLSSGLIAYLYFSQIKNQEDKIFLVGFSSNLSNFHDSKWEREFFQKEHQVENLFLLDLNFQDK